MDGRKSPLFPAELMRSDLDMLNSGSDKQVQAVMIARGLAPGKRQRVFVTGSERVFYVSLVPGSIGMIATKLSHEFKRPANL